MRPLLGSDFRIPMLSKHISCSSPHCLKLLIMSSVSTQGVGPDIDGFANTDIRAILLRADSDRRLQRSAPYEVELKRGSQQRPEAKYETRHLRTCVGFSTQDFGLRLHHCCLIMSTLCSGISAFGRAHRIYQHTNYVPSTRLLSKYAVL